MLFMKRVPFFFFLFLHYIKIPRRAEAPQGVYFGKNFLSKAVEHDRLTVDFPEPHIHIKGVLDDLRGDDLPASGVGYHTFFQEEELVAEGQRLVQIMEGRENGDVLFLGRFPGLFDDELLVGNVQIAGGLIENHQLGYLGHGPGNGDFLALTAG